MHRVRHDDPYDMRLGMHTDPLGHDLGAALEILDRLAEYGPSDEQLARQALYGDETRSGNVIRLGSDEPPVDERWMAA